MGTGMKFNQYLEMASAYVAQAISYGELALVAIHACPAIEAVLAWLGLLAAPHHTSPHLVASAVACRLLGHLLWRAR